MRHIRQKSYVKFTQRQTFDIAKKLEILHQNFYGAAYHIYFYKNDNQKHQQSVAKNEILKI